eukprot:6878813-Pyramimonas_sp.AAC.1
MIQEVKKAQPAPGVPFIRSKSTAIMMECSNPGLNLMDETTEKSAMLERRRSLPINPDPSLLGLKDGRVKAAHSLHMMHARSFVFNGTSRERTATAACLTSFKCIRLRSFVRRLFFRLVCSTAVTIRFKGGRVKQPTEKLAWNQPALHGMNGVAINPQTRDQRLYTYDHILEPGANQENVYKPSVNGSHA